MIAVRRVPRRLRTLSNFVGNILRHKRFVMGRRTGDRPAVLFDVETRSLRRYLYCLAKMFTEQGFVVFIKPHYRLVGRLRGYDRWLLTDDNIRFEAPDRRYEYVFTADPRTQYLNGILIDHKVFDPGEEQDALSAPFPIHPYHFRHGYPIASANHDIRPLRCFFSGRLGPQYGDPNLGDRFNLLTRRAVVDTLKRQDRFPLLEPTRLAELEGLLAPTEEPVGGVVIVDTDRFDVPIKRWLKTLQSVTFFIAPPGSVVPHCHNLPEAMSQGCIPILQYGEMLSPALEDDKNCLAFRDESDLIRTVHRALELGPQEVFRLRKGVLEYYWAHLSSLALIRKLRERTYRRILVNVERGSL